MSAPHNSHLSECRPRLRRVIRRCLRRAKHATRSGELAAAAGWRRAAKHYAEAFAEIPEPVSDEQARADLMARLKPYEDEIDKYVDRNGNPLVSLPLIVHVHLAWRRKQQREAEAS